MQPPPVQSPPTQFTPQPITQSAATPPTQAPPVTQATPTADSTQPAPARLQTSPPILHAVDVVLPAHAPPWLRDSVALFRKQDLGCHFTSLLAALVKLETVFGFDEQVYGVLPAEHRPKPVNAWIKGGRTTKTTKIPDITHIDKYADQWKRWWDGLQPKWRRQDGDGHWMVGGDATYSKDNKWGSSITPGPMAVSAWLPVFTSGEYTSETRR
ncbi:hypothetical protein B0H13DRAFT_1626786 [Mycena leptocephala]|nr:hypothetical protein B0H13DRAFT_1626786 [Mycena leptocephala]